MQLLPPFLPSVNKQLPTLCSEQHLFPWDVLWGFVVLRCKLVQESGPTLLVLQQCGHVGFILSIITSARELTRSHLPLSQILFVITFLQLPKSPTLTSGILVPSAARVDCERQSCPTGNRAALLIPILQAAEPRGNAWSKLIKTPRIIPL